MSFLISCDPVCIINTQIDDIWNEHELILANIVGVERRRALGQRAVAALGRYHERESEAENGGLEDGKEVLPPSQFNYTCEIQKISQIKHTI